MLTWRTRKPSYFKLQLHNDNISSFWDYHLQPLAQRVKSYHIVPLAIWYHLFFKFWLVHTWVFAHWHHQHAATHLENVRQLNIRQGKKLGFQLVHWQPLILRTLIIFQIRSKALGSYQGEHLFILWMLLDFTRTYHVGKVLPVTLSFWELAKTNKSW